MIALMSGSSLFLATFSAWKLCAQQEILWNSVLNNTLKLWQFVLWDKWDGGYKVTRIPVMLSESYPSVIWWTCAYLYPPGEALSQYWRELTAHDDSYVYNRRHGSILSIGLYADSNDLMCRQDHNRSESCKPLWSAFDRICTHCWIWYIWLTWWFWASRLQPNSAG